jgi:transcriptional regulator with XRE-family HTH domain
MADMYERIDELLKKRGITGAKMSSDLNMSRSFMTELRKGRAKSVKLDTAQKIADYLQVSVRYLTTGIPDNVIECIDDENPWQVDLLDAFDTMELDNQIATVHLVQNIAKNKISPSEFVLTEGEKKLILLFRKLPADLQESYPVALEMTLKAQGLL